VVLLGAFAAIELTRREPMLPLRLFRQRDFAGAQLSVFAISSSLFAIFLYLSLYLQGPLGRSPLQTGLAYLPGTTLMFFASAASPKVSAKIGDGALATLGLAMVTGGALLLLFAGTTSSWTTTLPGTMLAFAGTGLYNPPMSVIALSALPARHSGLASGAYDTFRQAGLALGTAALGALVPPNALSGAAPSGFVAGLHHAELVAAGIAALGTVITATLLVRRKAPALVHSLPEPFEA
jgi:predicted MFS family arabinose efflux permease